jgi:hypothetical protein
MKMRNLYPFKKKEKVGITKYGQVIVQDDGSVLVTGFTFNEVDFETSKELARAWALKSLRKA